MVLKVLLVEDEVLIRIGMRMDIETAGAVVVGEASDGETAILLAQEHRPDLICMDIRLHGPMDGLEVAQRIRRFSSAFILFNSAFIQNTESYYGDLQPCACVSKPLEPGCLESYLAKI